MTGTPTTARAPALPSRIPSLDGLRAISIGLVLIAHGVSTRGAPAALDIPALGSLGNVGVRFFFVISGFLITTLLLRDLDRYGRVRLRAFYIRRALRILPAFLVYVATMWCLYLGGVIELRYHHLSEAMVTSALPDLLHALTFTANYQLDYNWYFNHLWSLSVEEQFYLLWPCTLVWLGLRGGSRVAIGAIVLVPFVRLAMHLSGAFPEIALSREFQAVCDSIAMGCLTALLFNRLSAQPLVARLIGWPAIPLGGLCIAVGYGLAFVWRPGAYIVGQTVANLGIALLLVHVTRHPQALAGRILGSRPLVAVGVLSYSLYLWQEPFLYFRGSGWATAFPQNLMLAFAAATASYFLVERPFLTLKERFSSTRASPPREPHAQEAKA